MIKRVAVAAAGLFAAAVLGGLAAVGAWVALDDEGTTTASQPAAVVAQPVVVKEGSIAALYRKTVPGVVEITAESASGQGTATGSGFITDDEGHVVTNEHVVDGAGSVSVRFHDGREADARVVGTDPSTDVALLKLDDVPSNVRPLALGSSETLQIGDPVIAIGSPFGLEGTVTSGIVSGKGREIQAPDGFAIDGAIQTDAALNHGNSGGPLIDAAGRVVGMNSQIASESGGNDGIGYAVPAETVRSIVRQLQADGSVEHAYLGITLGDASGGGASVGQVRSGTPAQRAGLQAGDVVTSAGGTGVQTGDDLRRAVSEREPGDKLTLRVRRNGETRSLTVTLGTRPASAA